MHFYHSTRISFLIPYIVANTTPPNIVFFCFNSRIQNRFHTIVVQTIRFAEIAQRKPVDRVSFHILDLIKENLIRPHGISNTRKYNEIYCYFEKLVSLNDENSYLKVKPLAMFVCIIIRSDVQFVISFSNPNGFPKISTFKSRFKPQSIWQLRNVILKYNGGIKLWPLIQ